MIAFQSLDILFCIYLFINDFHLLPYAFFVDGFDYSDPETYSATDIAAME